MSNTLSRNERLLLKSFGFKVRQLRNSKGWTLEATEEHGWPSWRHLQKIEAGKNITLLTIYRLAKLFNISPKDFFL